MKVSLNVIKTEFGYKIIKVLNLKISDDVLFCTAQVEKPVNLYTRYSIMLSCADKYCRMYRILVGAYNTIMNNSL